MTHLIAPEELPNWVPGEITMSTDHLDWQHVSMRSYRYQGQDVQIPAMRDFMLVAYRTGVTPMKRRFDGCWSQATCVPGAVSLLTRSQESHWNWSETVDVTHAYLSPRLVSDVAIELTGHPVEDVSLKDILRTDDPLLVASMDALAVEASDAGIGSALYVESVARQMIIHLIRHYASITLTPVYKAGELSSAQLERIIEFIDSHLGDTLNLNSMAACLGLTTCSFARRFKASTGSPPYAFVLERRLKRAHSLLMAKRRTIKDIAASCGFSDQAHLTRLFARCYGTTPSAFRGRIR